MANMEENKIKPSGLVGNAVTAVVFLGLIFGFGLSYIFGSDREFSDMENRTLQQKPEFTLKRLTEGEFTSDIESYMSDQIAFKDELVTLKTASDRALGKTYMNGVYFGRDGYYLQDFQLNKTMCEKNIGCLNDFALSISDQAKCTLLAAPNAVYVMKDWLPPVTQTDDQGEALELIRSTLDSSVAFADPSSLMSASLGQSPVQLYYRTDHHWTEGGAFLGFKSLMRAMGEEVPDAHFSYITLDDFYGTLYSKAPAWGAQPDKVQILTQDEPNRITVRYVRQAGDHTVPGDCTEADGVPRREGLFDLTKAGGKDKYAAIMGGNFGLIEIEAEGAEKDESVLILKDSYANAMLPHLCSKYKHITLIDLRYYHMEEMSVSDYVREKDIKNVIFLYNVDFLNSDNNFVWLD